jgi:quercetin dioxygenase-like cupin family protein
MNKRRALGSAVALALAMLAGVALDRGLLAQQAPVTRKVLLTTDEPGSTTHEMVMATVEIAPGGASGKHKHPGIEIGYVVEGTLELQYEGRPTVTLTPGQSFKNEGVHNGINPGKTPTRLLAVFAVEKGKPMTEAVP